MLIKAELKKMQSKVRESEHCSCPVILAVDNQPTLAVFTFFLTGSEPLTVYGFGQIICSDGEKIWAQEKELFKSEEEQIVFENPEVVSEKEYEKRNSDYLSALQKYSDVPSAVNAVVLANTFFKLVPQEAVKLYRRIVPEYIVSLKNI